MTRKTRGAGTLSLIASVCAVGISAVLLRRFYQDAPPPDFTDFYLLFVLGIAYRYPWKFAAALAAVTLGVSVYVLAPLDWMDGFQLLSYTVCASVIIWVMASLRRRKRQTA
jgi:hypothetical protein